jgi:hypothetical protein
MNTTCVEEEVTVTTNETGRTDPASRPAAVDPDGEGELEDDVFEANEIEPDEPESSADGDTVVEGEPLDTEPSTAESSEAEPLSDEPSTTASSTTAERTAEEPQPEADDATAHADATTAAAPAVDEAFLADASGYQDRWNEIQTGFVDEPSRAVQRAGELLTDLMDDLARTLATDLETFGARGGARDEASTEDLRVAFQRCRSYFDRLLAV